jgi:carboxypeptidase Q
MKKYFSFLLLVSLFASTLSAQNYPVDSANLKRISNHILTNYTCYNDLRDLCKNIGNRLSGSAQAAQAVVWGKSVMEKMNCDKVWLQEVMVPHWVRGDEEASIINSKGVETKVVISSLGNAVGTGDQAIKAEIIQFDNIDELKKMTEKDIKGKIVFFNYRFNQTNISPFESYGPCVYYRWGAPSEAAKLGAIAVVIRSVSSAFDNKPHTGSMRYDTKYPSIPAVAISNLEADNLEALLQKEKQVQFKMRTTCQMLEDVKSYNVVGEIKGSELPDEIITVGGHLDSWDIGEGAHDDGAGVVQAMEVLRVFKEIGIRPKRTIRAVLYMNEENGLRGANKYATLAEENSEKHILCIESDAGGDVPLGFSMTCSAAQRKKVKSWSSLFLPYGVYQFDGDGGGADVGAMYKKFNTPIMELLPNSQRYFDYHHSANDVFENVHRRELCLGSVALSAMVYLVSEYGL